MLNGVTADGNIYYNAAGECGLQMAISRTVRNSKQAFTVFTATIWVISML